MDDRPLLDVATARAPSKPELLGTFGTLLQVFRLYCGTGLLAFPYAVKCGGLVAAPVALLVIGWCNNYTLKMLVRAKRKVRVQSHLLSPSLSSFDRLLTAFRAAFSRYFELATTTAVGRPIVRTSP